LGRSDWGGARDDSPDRLVLAQEPGAGTGAHHLVTAPLAFEQDVGDLPTHAFSYRSLTWWGIIGFMVIEGTAFALTIAAYFFLMSHDAEWAPRPWSPPGLLAATLFTILIL